MTSQNNNLPFTRSWWIEQDEVIGGRFPGTFDQIESNEMLENLIRLNVGLVINLQEPGESGANGTLFPNYKPTLSALARKYNQEIRFVNIPTPDMKVPTNAAIKQALDEIDQTLALGQKVYVHCWGGHGRTGVVAGCLLKRRKLTNEQVFSTIQSNRAHDAHLVKFSSPQTDKQRSAITRWQEN